MLAFASDGTQSLLKFIRLLRKLERLQQSHALIAEILLLASNFYDYVRSYFVDICKVFAGVSSVAH